MDKNNFFRKKLVIGIIILFVGASVVPNVSSNTMKVNNELYDGKKPSVESLNVLEEAYCIQRNGDNVTFHGNTSKPDSSWYVVRFSSDESISIKDMNLLVNQSNAEGFKSAGWTCILTNFETISYHIGMYTSAFIGGEWYLQVDIGPIDFVSDNLINTIEFSVNSSVSQYPFTISSGDWYLIWYATPGIGRFEISMDMSSEGDIVFFTPTEGSSTFYYESQQFLGKIVFRKNKLNLIPMLLAAIGVVEEPVWRSRSFIQKGQASIDVNDTFIGHFVNTMGYYLDRTKLQCITPHNDVLELAYTILMGKVKHKEGDFDYWDCIIGGDGTWQLNANQIALGGKWSPPYVCFIGADLKLPDTTMDDHRRITPRYKNGVLHGNECSTSRYSPSEDGDCIKSTRFITNNLGSASINT